jgi:hypothetical protein
MHIPNSYKHKFNALLWLVKNYQFLDNATVELMLFKFKESNPKYEGAQSGSRAVLGVCMALHNIVQTKKDAKLHLRILELLVRNDEQAE